MSEPRYRVQLECGEWGDETTYMLTKAGEHGHYGRFQTPELAERIAVLLTADDERNAREERQPISPADVQVGDWVRVSLWTLRLVLERQDEYGQLYTAGPDGKYAIRMDDIVEVRRA
jgi:hypothetical protein